MNILIVRKSFVLSQKNITFLHHEKKQYIAIINHNVCTTDTRSYKNNFLPHLEMDFLIDSGVTLKVFNNNTCTEIKE